MGTQVHYKVPGYYSMRDLNEDSNSSSWPLFYGDTTLTSGQYYNGYVQKTIIDPSTGHDKDSLKHKMLEHEAIFKNQVCELHRLYRIQRDMMEDIRRTEIHKHQMSIEPSSSSSLLGSQMPSKDAGKWHMPRFPLANSGYPRPSVSGAEIVNSPLSCTKGNNAQAVRMNNGSTSKDCEVLEVRPSKVRKKLFDLRLPADEYIDTDEVEQLPENKVSNISSSLPNGNNKVAPENHKKIFQNGTVEKFDYQKDASTSESCFRKPMKVADLNEPIEVEDGLVPLSVDFCVNSANCGETNGLNLSAKPSSDFLALQKEMTQSAHFRGNQNGAPPTMSVGSKGNERDWLCGLQESDHRMNNLISVSQGIRQDHQSAQVSFNGAHPPPLPTNYGREGLLNGRVSHGLETLGRIHAKSNNNNLESVVSAQVPSPYLFANSSDFANSWSHSALSWAKPTSSMTEKLSSLHAYPSLNSCTSLTKSSQSSAQSHGVLGEKWQINGSSRLNPGTIGLPIMNGFYHGSSSGSKEMLSRYPSVSFSHVNYNGIDNAVPGRSLNNRPADMMKGSNYVDIKPVKDMDLNVVHSKSSSIEAVSYRDVEITHEKREPESHLAALPWIKSKAASKSEAINNRIETKSDGFGFFKAPSVHLNQESEHVKYLNKTLTQKVLPGLSDSENRAKETSEVHGVKKLLGFPIFEKPSTSRHESSLPISTSATVLYAHSSEKLGTETRRRIIDINLACDEEKDLEVPSVEKAVEIKDSHIKTSIDLNSSLSEDEDPVVTSVASNTAVVKIVVDIDLEAPVQEIEDDFPPAEEIKQNEASLPVPGPNFEETQNEMAKLAAEAIILLSSSSQQPVTEENTCQPSEDPLDETLLWFADVLTSTTIQEIKGGKEFKGKDCLVIGNYHPSDEMDDFEVMTLQLQETKEEEYMPKPFVPEVQNVDEPGANSVPNRSRKGQVRRGRPRRDFQRDILPGLASLSRHEVTEDLQTFGGLMRATGYTWNSVPTRRNGGARGRRRISVVETASIPAAANASCTPLIQQLNNIEVVGLEDRSLTGWGKTTRRPRRQRCPAANPPTTVTLT